MKVVVDMNLAPEWAEVLNHNGIQAVHWSSVGDPRAPDSVIMQWARDGGWLVFTPDLDFGTLLAHTFATGPSVIQLRTQDVLPTVLAGTMVAILRQYESQLMAGALVTVDEARHRVRLLPIKLAES